MPVRIVVPLLRALVTTSVPVVVLTSVLCRVATEISVGCEEAHVTTPQFAVGVVVKILVHTKFKISVAIVVITSGRVVRNGASGWVEGRLIKAQQLLFTIN